MTVPLKMVAQEILMCGLRQIPILGPAFEVVDGVQKRHELLRDQERLQRVEQELTSFDRRMRGLVQEEIQTTILGLAQPDLSVGSFTSHIKNLLDIKQNGWSPALFQGLLDQSAYWDELCANPSHYGQVLGDHDQLDSNKLQVFIDADKTRILELTPFALHGLLTRQRKKPMGAQILAGPDVWAVPSGDAIPGIIAANLPPTPVGIPQSKPNRSELIVCAKGTGQFWEIADAISAATTGVIIKVRPGIYRKSVDLSKEVEVVAEGSREQVVIETTDGACVVMNSEVEAALVGFSIRVRVQDRKKHWNRAAVETHRGRLVLKDCDISSTADMCIRLGGSGHRFINCIIRDAKIGVMTGYAASGLFEGCDIRNNTDAGVAIGDSSNLSIRKCRINRNGVGIQTEYRGNSGARGLVEHCDITGNRLGSFYHDNVLGMESESAKKSELIVRNCTDEPCPPIWKRLFGG